MFSDEAFESVRPLLEQSMVHRNPQAEIDKLDEEIERVLEEYADIKEKDEKTEETYKAAVSILIQGRNLVARFIGDEEREVPEIETQADFSPLTKKHVAICLPDNIGSGFSIAIKRVVDLTASWTRNEATRIKYYGSDQRHVLTKNILDGRICGIIALHSMQEDGIAGSIRHELKDLLWWNYEKAERYTLPPCADLRTPLGDPIYKDRAVLALPGIIRQMLKGEYKTSGADSEKFSLQDTLPSLVPRMQTPIEQLDVVIIDDNSLAVAGLIAVLKDWPKLETQIIMAKNGDNPDTITGLVTPRARIVLLDEALRSGLTGTEVMQKLRQLTPFQRAVIASTSTGSKPGWARYHFRAKSEVSKSERAAREFVSFMNLLIIAAEERG